MGIDSEIVRMVDQLATFNIEERVNSWILLCEILVLFNEEYDLTGVTNIVDQSIYRNDFKQVLRAMLIVLEVEFPIHTIAPGSNILNEDGQCIANIKAAIERLDIADDVTNDSELNRIYLELTLYMNRMNYTLSQMTV